jgi:hypothetical protein
VIGSRVGSRDAPPRNAFLCLAGGIALGALGMIARLPAMVPLAACPLAIGTCLLLVGERRFDARFTADAIDVARPRQRIPYVSLLEVRPLSSPGQARPLEFSIQVVHARGLLLFPASLTVPSERVYAFLKGYVPEHPPRILPPALEEYRAEQETRFGADRVWPYVGRRGKDLPTRRGLRGLASGLFATAAVWTAVPLLQRESEPGWWVAAVVAGLLAALLVLLDHVNRRRTGAAGEPPKAGSQAVVISPLGLAVQQVPVSGHLGWEEIRKVSIRAPGGRFSGNTTAVAAIALEVEGTTILLTDTYDRPLAEIHERILRYWR